MPCYSYTVPVSIRLNDPVAVCDLFDRAAEALRSSPYRAGSSVNLPGRGRLLLTGDLHDNPAHFEKIVRLARLGESDDCHVILHEIIHGEMLVNGVDMMGGRAFLVSSAHDEGVVDRTLDAFSQSLQDLRAEGAV